MSRRAAIVLVGLGLLAAGLFAALGPASAQETGDWLVTRDELNLRAGTGTEAAVLEVLPRGARVELVALRDGDWAEVRYRGRTGYAARAYLATSAAAGGAGSPAFSLNLPVPFYRQLTAVWCDPAVIQSWYEYVSGRTVPDSYAFQAATWEWETANNLGFTLEQWNASPYAVASALHHHLPDRGFNHWKADDPVAATRTLAWFLANPAYRQPAIALIRRGEHYVLVRGVEADGDPYRDYPRANIRGLYLLDPNQGAGNWLGTNFYVSMSDWTARYLTPVSYLTPHTGVPGDQWQGKHVTIQADWRVGPPLEQGRTPADLAAHLAAGER